MTLAPLLSKWVGAGWAGATAQQLALLWAGLTLGVSFLATPAKFLAPSLPLPIALDVGRHTFRVLNPIEIGLGVALLSLGLTSRPTRSRAALLLVPLALAAGQGAVLTPRLDARVEQVIAGETPARSSLHAIYIGSDVVKVAALLAIGFGLAGVARRREAHLTSEL